VIKATVFTHGIDSASVTCILNYLTLSLSVKKIMSLCFMLARLLKCEPSVKYFISAHIKSHILFFFNFTTLICYLSTFAVEFLEINVTELCIFGEAVKVITHHAFQPGRTLPYVIVKVL
jgi:hypothetical protein